jgi:riboflavin transporter FmnP
MLILNDYDLMDTKSITIIVTFTAMCIVLIPIRIPTIYWPGFAYYFWEIPIIIAFLLFGFRVALSTAVLNAAARLVFFPGPAPLLSLIMGFPPLLTMLLGIHLARKLIQRQVLEGKSISTARATVYLTALGVAVRAGIMPFIDYAEYIPLFPFFGA